MLIDTHAHLTDDKFDDDVEDVIKRAFDNGLAAIINVGDNLERSKKAVDMANRYDNMFAAVGIHPHESGDLDDNALSELEQLAADPKVVAIGEIGLDYYYDTYDREIQRFAFSRQIELANKLSLPIIVHDRDAHGDTIETLESDIAEGVKGVLHCFSGSYEFAMRCIDLGLYISLAGPVTFKNARKAVEVAEKVPADRLLVETDSPYLAPVPVRGKRNEPAYVLHTARKIAGIRGVDEDTFFDITGSNAVKLFGLKEVGN